MPSSLFVSCIWFTHSFSIYFSQGVWGFLVETVKLVKTLAKVRLTAKGVLSWY